MTTSFKGFSSLELVRPETPPATVTPEELTKMGAQRNAANAAARAAQAAGKTDKDVDAIRTGAYLAEGALIDAERKGLGPEQQKALMLAAFRAGVKGERKKQQAREEPSGKLLSDKSPKDESPKDESTTGYWLLGGAAITVIGLLFLLRGPPAVTAPLGGLKRRRNRRSRR